MSKALVLVVAVAAQWAPAAVVAPAAASAQCADAPEALPVTTGTVTFDDRDQWFVPSGLQTTVVTVTAGTYPVTVDAGDHRCDWVPTCYMTVPAGETRHCTLPYIPVELHLAATYNGTTASYVMTITRVPTGNDELSECRDGVDNDADGLTDYPADPQCTTPESRTEGLPVFPSDECDDGTNVIAGAVQGAYVKLRYRPVTTAGADVCFAYEPWPSFLYGSPKLHFGGRLSLRGLATPVPAVVDQDAASVGSCAAAAGNVRVQSGTAVGQPYWVDVAPAPRGGVWLCVRLTAAVGFRLRFDGDSASVTGFAADTTVPHQPGYSVPWAGSGPSSTCAAASDWHDAFGPLVRGVNVVVGTTPVGLYYWGGDDTRTHVCVRVGGTGGRFTVDSAKAPAVTTGDSTAPCPFDIITRAEAPTYGAYVSDPGQLPDGPVSACVDVAGTALSVTVAADGSVATWAPDPE